MNIFNYINKYKDKTFTEEIFNEVDNLIFSLLSYLNFSKYELNKKTTINYIGSMYLKDNLIKDIKNINFASKDAYIMLKNIYNTKRYKDVCMYNYKYIGNSDTQFSALTFKINNNLIYVSYEGTDNLLSGWKEDLNMSYEHLVEAQKSAINYLNETVSVFDKNIIVGGHSKGGNLALISSMYCNSFIRLRIKKIYNNDGPGLNLKQVHKFNKIKSKYVHIIPDYSYVGILLIDSEYKVIKSKKKNIQSHNIINWQINDNKLIEAKLSKKSKKIQDSILSWLNDNDYDTRKIMLDNIYQVFDNSGIESISDFKNIKNIFKIIKHYKKVDSSAKEITENFLLYNLKNILNK